MLHKTISPHRSYRGLINELRCLTFVVALLVPALQTFAETSVHVVDIPQTVQGTGTSGTEVMPLLQDPDRPALPYYDVSILLEPGTDLADVVITPLDPTTARLETTLPAARPSLSSEGLPALVRPVPGGELVFPSVWGEAMGTSVWHGFSIAQVRIYPHRAHRERPGLDWGSLEEAVSFELVVTTRPHTGSIVKPERRREGEHHHHQDAVARKVVNPGAVTSYADPSRAVTLTDKGFAPSAAPSMLGSAVDVLIVTTSEMKPAFEQLAEWRTRLGMPTTVRTMDWIEQVTLPAEDRPATLRNFLTDAYTRWGVRWVLLGGDVEVIPTRMIYNTYYPAGSGTDVPVDLYYGGLDGNWNADGDEVLGEPYLNGIITGDEADLVAELLVGRAPVVTLEEAQLFVDKIISYEYGNTGAHNGRILMLSEVLFPSSYTSGDEITDDGATYSENIADAVLFDEDVTITRLYEAWDLWPGAQPETAATARDGMDSGSYGIVNHVGHGFFYTMSVGEGTLGVKDASGLQNDPHYFLLNNLNCASAAFDYNSIMERFVVNPNGGAVAALGSSRAAFPTTAGAYQFSFFEALFDLQSPTLGDAVADGRQPFDAATYEDTVQRWTHMTLALIGDPSMTIWRSEPDTMSISSPDTMVLGSGLVEVLVEQAGAPLPGADVCLYREGEDYSVATTGVDGRAFVPYTAKFSGPVSLGVSYPGSRPHVSDITVAPAGPAYLHLSDLTIVDDGTLGSIGNADGVPDAGETVALLTDWTNTGLGASAAAATISLSVSDPLVTVLDATAEIPALPAGATMSTVTPFLIALDTAMVDRSEVSLEFLAIVDGRSCPDESAIDVYAPKIEASILGWNDFPLGNGNGNIEGGEQIRLWLSILNTGWGKAEGLTGWLETDTPYVTVIQGTANWPDVERFGEVSQLDEFIVAMGVVSEVVEAILHISDAAGHTWVHRISLTVPAQTSITAATAPAGGEALLTWNPNSESDVLGYHVWRAPAPGGPFTRMTVQPLVGASFYRDTGLTPLSTFFYKVATIDESRILSRYSSILSISTPPGELLGFPVPMTAETSSHLAVGDVNGDGILDMVSAADAIYVWSADGNELLDGDNDPLSLGPFIAIGEQWTPAGVTLGNLSPQFGLEIVASCRSNRSIYVFQADGTIAPGWPQVMNGWNWATPAVGDLDNDGDLEIVVTNVQGYTYVWHHDGTEFLDGDANPATNGVFHIRVNEWYSFSSPGLVDLNDDGTLEIILGTRISDGTTNYLHALQNNGSDLPGWPVSLMSGGKVQCSPAISDLDDDGILEIVFVTEDDKLHVVDQFGLNKGPFPISFVANNAPAGGVCPSPALGDFDLDGRLDIVAISVSGTHTSEIHVVDLDGNLLPGWPRAIAGASESSPIVGDVTGDGRLDVIFGIGGASDTQPNYLYAFSYNGGTVPGFPLSMEGPVRATPTLSDVDNDGDIDLVYAGWDLALHVWDFPTPWDPNFVSWPTFQGNPLRTGMLPQSWATSVEDPPSPLPASLELSQNSPNPFNPATVISFAVPAGTKGRTTLQVHDLRGRIVATLVDDDLEAGRYDATWTGRDDGGRPQASGVYLYRLSTEDGSRSGRMVLVR